MGTKKVNNLQRLHKAVIHEKVWEGPEGRDWYTLEDREITKITNNNVLYLICPKCFPLIGARPKYPSREYWQYDKFYPVITEVIW